RAITESEYGTAESARRPPPVRALSRGSPGAAQRRPVAEWRNRARDRAPQLRVRERTCARTITESEYGTAESARRPPPVRAPSRGSPGAAQRRPVVELRS